MKKTAVLAVMLALVLGLTGCTAPENATKHLLDAGYTNIQITGYKPFACSEDDVTRTGFTALGPTNRVVSDTVCGGSIELKGATIQLD